jgi:hypothetical protein
MVQTILPEFGDYPQHLHALEAMGQLDFGLEILDREVGSL